MDVPLDVVKARDPKGLYAKVAKGLIKGFTGIDAPYEAPLTPEITLHNHQMSVDKCVDVLITELKRRGFLSGYPDIAKGLAAPDGGEHVNLIVPPDQLPAKLAEAASLPKVPLTDLDTNWLQVIGEGWAAPLKGFMREGILMQTLHFNSMLVDTHNFTGLGGYATSPTEWMQNSFPRERASMPVPIVLPITDFTRRSIGKAKAVTLTSSAGVPLAILRLPEVYELRHREIISRTWGVIDDEHPYIKEALLAPGKVWTLGGEIELLGRIKYNDGLDKYRLTVDELRAAFQKKGADVIYAFQTRNPTHAGHGFLMKDSRRKLMERGYKNPVLWLSPLGGWTKSSDVPLDVRVKQHHEVMAAGELHPDWTVMAIWPSPMIYAGPTEVQFHAKSRRVAGASYFTVGRDPAGMPYMSGPNKGDDLYHPDHGRYVLMSSPGVGDMEFLGFEKVYYDKKDHTMRGKDKSRKDDFISISGSKMRKLAALGAKPCPPQIPSDLVAAKCIPPGFMVPKGWDIVSDYYIRQKTGDWVPFSKQLGGLAVAPSLRTTAEQPFGKASFAATFVGADGVTPISPWHDLPLVPAGATGNLVNFMCEIPRGVTAKLEVQKKLPHNPIMQDTKKGKLRYYTYGPTFFNYGMLPQTWEDPSKKGFNGTAGDNDPLDVMEVGSVPFKVGEVRKVKVLGDLELIDQGELDHKIIVIDAADPLADRLTNAADLRTVMPGVLENLVEWLKMYKTTDGKAINALSSDEPKTADAAMSVITECHLSWKALKARGPGDTGFWLK